MAKTNTEQPANKAEQKKMIQPSATSKPAAPKPAPIEKKKEDKQNQKTQENKSPKVKKKKSDKAVANAKNLHMSTKTASAICKFIKGKPLSVALKDLEEVANLKKAVPMKGEIPHRKGNIMSGRYPVKAANQFIMLLKNLIANADQNELQNPIVKEAIANKGQLPYAKGGRWRRKRSHVFLTAKEKVNKTNNSNK